MCFVGWGGASLCATPPYKTQNRNNKNIPNTLSYTDPYQVRRGRGRPGPLFGYYFYTVVDPGYYFYTVADPALININLEITLDDVTLYFVVL